MSRAGDVAAALSNADASLFKRIFVLEHAAARYAAIHRAQLQRLQSRFVASRKQKKVQQQKDIGSMCRALNRSHAAPIARMREGEGHCAPIRTHPLQVDNIIRTTMGKINDGNSCKDRRAHMVDAFLRNFGQFFIQQPAFAVPPLLGKDLAEAIARMPDNTTRLDGVKKGDLIILSPLCLDLIANLLNAIEEGAAWPQPCNAVRTAFFSKGEDDLSPQGFRGLAILSKLYRMWAGIRLRHVDEWVDSWSDQGLFAGCNRPVGAEDAWFLEALVSEEARLSGEQVSGGSTDIWKCFDQIEIEFLCALLALGGCPTRILRGYSAFHAAAVYYNTVAGGLEEPHAHRCSIPQGCPFSMTMVAFLLSPWARYMRSLKVSPRALADDILISAHGPGHLIRFKTGYSGTFSYLHCIRAKVAAKKCFTFSSDGVSPGQLKQHFWTHTQARDPCVTTSRDLGGQLNVGSTLCGTTLIIRIGKAIRLFDLLQRMPWDRNAKLRVVRTLILPTALYGCEVAPPGERQLGLLTIAIVPSPRPWATTATRAATFSPSI